jgi:glycerol-3-phosphate acyltransferase PlsY
MNSILELSILPVVAAYFCGSLPVAYILVKIIYRKNIFSLGSGNGGATNVFRIFGKGPGFTVFLLDFTKGFLPLLWANNSGLSTKVLLSMVAAVLIGHAFPIWTRFKGGKGVAVSAGAISAIFPLAAPFCAMAFGLTLLATKYVSLSSLAAAFSLPVINFLMHMADRQEDFWLREGFFLIFFLLVLYFHRSNIVRLFHGEEKKIGQSKQD